MNATTGKTAPHDHDGIGACIEGQAASRCSRLTDRDVPDRDRMAYMHDFVARRFAGLQFTPKETAGFEFELAYRQLDDETVIGSARYSAVRGERTRELTGDGRSNYMLTIHDRDFESETGRGQTLNIARGDITIVNESERHAFTLPETRLMALVLAERRMGSMTPAIRTKAFHHIPAAAPGAALMAGYARLLLSESDLDASAAKLAGDHLYHLAALAIDQMPGCRKAPLPGIGGARLALIKEDIARNLTDPELDVVSVALRQGVTPRYVQRLFEREGTSFGRFLRDARLDRAKEMLEACDGRTVSAIAFDSGFGDLSHFNRAFRQRFGLTPRDVKAAVLRVMQ